MSRLREALERNLRLYREDRGGEVFRGSPPERADLPEAARSAPIPDDLAPPERAESRGTEPENIELPRITFASVDMGAEPSAGRDLGEALERWMRPAARRCPAVGREEELL